MKMWRVELEVNQKCGTLFWDFIISCNEEEKARELALEAYRNHPMRVVEEPEVYIKELGPALKNKAVWLYRYLEVDR
jgi:hypothetical protein